VKVLEVDLRQKCPPERNHEIEDLVAKLHKPNLAGCQTIPFIAPQVPPGRPRTLGANSLLFALPKKPSGKPRLRKNPALAGTVLGLRFDSAFAGRISEAG